MDLPASLLQPLFGSNTSNLQTRHGFAQPTGYLGQNGSVTVVSSGLHDGERS